jgi:hypothetical protein
MKLTTISRTGFVILALSAALPGWADMQFRARKMTRNDVPLGKGQCDIRLQIDGEVEVSVRGDFVYLRTISGRDGRDDGSECNEPLPNGPVEGFNFDVKDNRGEIRLMAEPSRRTDYQAVVRIRDSASGEGRYHFRLTWMITPGNRFEDPDDRRGGLAWNNTLHFTGRGNGVSTTSGYGTQRLFDATVDMDRGGRILVSFRTDSRRPLTFSGMVVDSDRDGWRADVSTDDRARLRGSMHLLRDARGDLFRVELEATNGQDRLHLEWGRR